MRRCGGIRGRGARGGGGRSGDTVARDRKGDQEEEVEVEEEGTHESVSPAKEQQPPAQADDACVRCGRACVIF